MDPNVKALRGGFIVLVFGRPGSDLLVVGGGGSGGYGILIGMAGTYVWCSCVPFYISVVCFTMHVSKII